jgi:hypothetical protein
MAQGENPSDLGTLRQVMAPGTLLRLCGGITFQPVYTFSDRMREIADRLRRELLRGEIDLHWDRRGFEVTLTDDAAKIRVRHIQRENWYALLSDHDVFFQYDTPPADDVVPIMEVQTNLYEKLCVHLDVQGLGSIGMKFISLIRVEPDLRAAQQLLGLDPSQLLQGLASDLKETSFRLGYKFGIGAASLQVSSNRKEGFFVVDLDCYCHDVLTLGGNYLRFMLDAYDHFSREVATFLRPFVTPFRKA